MAGTTSHEGGGISDIKRSKTQVTYSSATFSRYNFLAREGSKGILELKSSVLLSYDILKKSFSEQSMSFGGL